MNTTKKFEEQFPTIFKGNLKAIKFFIIVLIINALILLAFLGFNALNIVLPAETVLHTVASEWATLFVNLIGFVVLSFVEAWILMNVIDTAINARPIK